MKNIRLFLSIVLISLLVLSSGKGYTQEYSFALGKWQLYYGSELFSMEDFTFYNGHLFIEYHENGLIHLVALDHSNLFQPIKKVKVELKRFSKGLPEFIYSNQTLWFGPYNNSQYWKFSLEGSRLKQSKEVIHVEKSQTIHYFSEEIWGDKVVRGMDYQNYPTGRQAFLLVTDAKNNSVTRLFEYQDSVKMKVIKKNNFRVQFKIADYGLLTYDLVSNQLVLYNDSVVPLSKIQLNEVLDLPKQNISSGSPINSIVLVQDPITRHVFLHLFEPVPPNVNNLYKVSIDPEGNLILAQGLHVESNSTIRVYDNKMFTLMKNPQSGKKYIYFMPFDTSEK
jgi:hypothetical protein